MTWIIKRLSGDREAFEAEKIRRSIKKAYIDAGKRIEDRREEIDRIADEVIAWVKKETDGMETKKIRDRVVARLEEVEPDAAEAWKMFEEKYKKM